jgi:hypothetical protein
MMKRKTSYRKLAAKLARRYKTIIVEDLSISKRAPKPQGEQSPPRRSR